MGQMNYLYCTGGVGGVGGGGVPCVAWLGICDLNVNMCIRKVPRVHSMTYGAGKHFGQGHVASG